MIGKNGKRGNSGSNGSKGKVVPKASIPITKPTTKATTVVEEKPTLARKSRIDPSLLKRARMQPVEEEPELEPVSVSAGAVDKVIDLAFNPTREKIREVTIIDRLQGRFFPILDMVNTLSHYCLEIAMYRQDKDEYFRLTKRKRPLSPDAMDDLLFRTAQWQKSIQGKNLERATDIALAETENKTGEEDFAQAMDGFKEG